MLSQLGHENIVKLNAVCQDPMTIMLDYVYFDVEVLGGEGKLSSLNELIYLIDSPDFNGTGGTFRDKIAANVAGGLLHLHENGIAHRDLKPANVLFTNHRYRVKTDHNEILKIPPFKIPHFKDSHF